MSIKPICPNCGNLVIGTIKSRGKTYCPHCKIEIMVTIKNKLLLWILLSLFVCPILLFGVVLDLNLTEIWEYGFWIYFLIIFISIMVFIQKNVEFIRGRSKYDED